MSDDKETAAARLRELGFAKLADNFGEEAARALAAARTMAGRLPEEQAPEQEPAHVFRPGEP